eukprot:4887250-Prymnesium_polylepis.2
MRVQSNKPSRSATNTAKPLNGANGALRVASTANTQLDKQHRRAAARRRAAPPVQRAPAGEAARICAPQHHAITPLDEHRRAAAPPIRRAF